MRVLLDAEVLTSPFGLLDAWRAVLGNATVEAFDPFATPAALHARFVAARPDVLVVSPNWLVTTPLLFTLLDQSGNLGTRRVIGSRVINDVVKIQSLYRGYFDVIDISRPSEDVAKTITRIHRGVSSLENDSLWARVPRPSLVGEVSSGARNETDDDILELLCLGMRDVDIAAALFLSVQTIKNRISSMLDRSGMNNRTQLAFQFTNLAMVDAMSHHAHHEKSCPFASKIAS